jgi:hypothetical protein
MESVFGKYLFKYEFEYNGKKGFYNISGDTRDYVATRNTDPEIDKKLFPEWFSFGKMNNEFVACSIENEDLYDAILSELQIQLKQRGIQWQSHYS